MRRVALLLFLGVSLALFLGVSLAFAQSPAPATALPATPPTAVAPPASITASAPKIAQPAGRRAQVVYSQGQLSVTADNASLNQILRDIARQTGMKITGGVADERVFGKYGPGAPCEVLTSLLDGTGSNMLLRETASHAPAELILTARQGGPTPPNPNAPDFDDDAPSNNEQSNGPSQPIIHPDRQIPPARQPFVPQTEVPPQAAGFVSAPTIDPSTEPGTTPGPNTQLTGTSDQQTPNGARTPQQIYQQLQQLQTQQPASPK